MAHIATVIFCTISLFAVSMTTAAEEWSWAEPNKWPVVANAECGGSSQSPIDIQTADARVGQPSYLKVWVPRRVPSALKLYQTDKNIRLDLSSRGIELSGSGFWSHMQLASVHYHAPSEHTINGKRYALEQHLVFAPVDNDALVADGQTRNDMVVIGQLFDTVSDDAGTTPDLMTAIAPSLDAAAGGQELFLRFTPSIVISERFYMYRGSLTTPPCSELINWHVGTTIGQVRQSDYNTIVSALRKAANGASATDLGNARPTQPVNGRQVLVRNVFSTN